jgi:hypothetical protein
MKPSQVLAALKHLIKVQRPVFLWGPPGIYKSDVVAQLAKGEKLELKDVRLSLLDPVDLKGFPTPGKVGAKAVMTWLPPDFLPTKGKGILFLDEMNSAAAAVQAAAYQLILNRKIGDYELPEGWSIVCAGNRAGDRSVVHAMPAALANRFIHIDCEVDPDEWIDWAIKNGVSDATRGYIRYRPGNLCVNKIEPGMRAFPTPRTWAFADQIIGSKLSSDVELELLKGTVGEGVAVEYMGFLRSAKDLPDIDQIMIDPDGVRVPDSPATCHALISVLESRVNPNNVDRFLKFVKRMSKEFEVVFMTASIRHDDNITSTKCFIDWSRENRSILVG